jgi:hypothetical protein
MTSTLVALALLACAGDTSTTTDSNATTPGDSDPGLIYDNSYCDEDGHTDAQQACCDYISAYNTCAETYGSTDWKDAETTGCAAAGDDTQTTWECLKEVYETGDCTTQDGWQALIQSAIGC